MFRLEAMHILAVTRYRFGNLPSFQLRILASHIVVSFDRKRSAPLTSVNRQILPFFLVYAYHDLPISHDCMHRHTHLYTPYLFPPRLD
jgi:hypothetical protein